MTVFSPQIMFLAFSPTDEQIHEWVDETASAVIKDGRGDGCRHFVVAAEGSVDLASGL